MPDQLEQAADIELAYRDEAERHALRRANEVAAPQHHIKFDGVNCVDCDMPIPSARLLMRRVRCVACQEALDKRTRR